MVVDVCNVSSTERCVKDRVVYLQYFKLQC